MRYDAYNNMLIIYAMWHKRLTFLCFGLLLPISALADIQLPALISDNMVLQQGKPIKLWGQAPANTQITASLANQQASTSTNTQGHWQLQLKPIKTGNYYLTLKSKTPNGKQAHHIINNVAVGEVWLASGQSNMEWPLRNTHQASQALNSTRHSNIRFFQVNHNTALTPLRNVQGEWVVMNPQSAKHVSGVAYHFAQQLQQQIQSPIGIIQSTWGNTKIQAWMGQSALSQVPLARYLLDKLYQDTYLTAAQKQARIQQQAAWEHHNLAQDHTANQPPQGKWSTVSLPTTFNALGFKDDGVIWFKRSIQLPNTWQQQAIQLHLGKIDDFDQVFFNGQLIGKTDKNTPHHWLKSRQYTIPAHLIRSGENEIRIRVFDQYSDGGFTSPATHLKLTQHKKTLPLSGRWQYQITQRTKPKTVNWASKPKTPFGLHNRNTPAALYNAMIAPLTHYPLRGVIWYQGEADAGRAKEYAQYFPAMIKQWRQAWREAFPFLFVQLANFEADKRNPHSTTWAAIRSAQTQTGKQVANTGMITAIDVGNAHDIHPKDKATVGQRLAQKALALAYQRGGYPAPKPQQIHYQQQSFYVQFSNQTQLSHKGNITAFEVMDQHGQWHFGHAKIKENQIQVWPAWSHHQLEARALRYAWKNNPKANIYNQYGLPLKPFEHYLP